MLFCLVGTLNKFFELAQGSTFVYLLFNEKDSVRIIFFVFIFLDDTFFRKWLPSDEVLLRVPQPPLTEKLCRNETGSFCRVTGIIAIYGFFQYPAHCY